MDGVSGAGGYSALGNTTRTDSSASILRRAVDDAKPGAREIDEISIDGVVDVTGADASAEASAPSRPIGNLGQHLDLQL